MLDETYWTKGQPNKIPNENTFGNADQKICISLLNKKIRHRISDYFEYQENAFIVLWKFLTQVKEFLKILKNLKLVACKEAI